MSDLRYDALTEAERTEAWNEWRAANERNYNVVRFYFRGGRRVIHQRVTLKEAQAHCADPETSSSTRTSATGRARTRRLGRWFDGYESR